MNRKIFCEIVSGVTYEERCLFALSKVIEGNKVCENCILRELKTLKRCGVKMAVPKALEQTKLQREKKSEKKPRAAGPRRRGSNDIKATNDRKVSNDVKVINDVNVSNVSKEAGDIKEYDVCSLSKVLGKSIRRVQELAKAGKIPARKAGPHWRFDKKEIDHWLSERESSSNIVMTTDAIPTEEEQSKRERTIEEATGPTQSQS